MIPVRDHTVDTDMGLSTSPTEPRQWSNLTEGGAMQSAPENQIITR
jgi:hypothetical protein